MTQAHLDTIMAAAGLTPEEAVWSRALLHMLFDLHVGQIGNATERGLFHHLQALELDSVRSLWWPLPPPRGR